jgi:hypothetical protein
MMMLIIFAFDMSSQIAEKRLAKKKKAVAQHVENYKLRKETLLRESMIIRSGFAFDAPSRTISGPGKGDCSARVRFAWFDKSFSR